MDDPAIMLLAIFDGKAGTGLGITVNFAGFAGGRSEVEVFIDVLLRLGFSCLAAILEDTVLLLPDVGDVVSAYATLEHISDDSSPKHKRLAPQG